MIIINVHSSLSVDIENKNYQLEDKDSMVRFIEDLLNKIYYGGERICLESVEILPGGKKGYVEIGRWTR